MASTNSAGRNLDSQQKHFTSIEFDLRINNLAKFIHRKLGTKKGSLMDIGAGSGLMVKYFKHNGFTVGGVELDSELVKRMKKDPQLEGLDISQGDITKLKGKEQYDIVISNDVIEHIEDDRLAIQNLWSFVKPKGLLVITVPAHSFLFCQRDVNWGHYRRYDKSDLVEKVSELKGKIKFVTYWNTVGFFVYLFLEKILKLKIHEEIRYNKSKSSGILKKGIELLLNIEKFLGGTPLGLSLVIGIEKK